MRTSVFESIARWAFCIAAALATSSCGLSAHRTPRLLVVGSTSDSPSTTPGFRMVVWNVHKLSTPAFQETIERIADSTRADFLLLQEAVIPVDSTRRAGLLPAYRIALSANLARHAPAEEIGVATASRPPLLDREALLSPVGEPLAGTRKAALRTTYAMDGGTLAIINVHALNFSPSLDGFRHQLGTIADLAGKHAGPAIVAGDFNSWSAGKLRLLDSMLVASGLERVDFGAGELRKKRMFGHALDHVYFTPAFLAVDSAGTRVLDRIRISDHVPLVVAFRFLPAR